jgi:hypothetical protein
MFALCIYTTFLNHLCVSTLRLWVRLDFLLLILQLLNILMIMTDGTLTLPGHIDFAGKRDELIQSIIDNAIKSLL